MKYVIVKPTNLPADCAFVPKYPVLFPDHICHSDMVPTGFEAVSAGFVHFSHNGYSVVCSGKSESLKLHSHKNADETLIDALIYMGESFMISCVDTYDEEFARDEAHNLKSKI
jgi:hypothetical protein